MNNKPKVDVANMSLRERARHFGNHWDWSVNTPKNAVKDWSLMGKYNQAKAWDHLVRSASFAAGPFASGLSENALNSIGMVTKYQKNSFLMKWMIPLGAAYSAYSAIEEKDLPQIPAYVAATAIGMTAYRPVAELGHAVGKSLGMGGGARLIGYGVGLPAGIAAAAIGYGAGYALGEVGSNQSFLQETQAKLSKGLIRSRNFETENTLTARQRAVGKLSRSGLNDRGQMLGQESLIMRGII